VDPIPNPRFARLETVRHGKGCIGAMITRAKVAKDEARMWRGFKDFLAVRRAEFLPVEASIFLMPVFLAAQSTGEIVNAQVLQGAFIFFLLYTMGDVINCVADRDLDAQYKSRLSSAVDRLGAPFLWRVVVGCTVVSVLLAAHLAYAMGNPWILVLVLVGAFLGIQYSIRPFHFKSQGPLHLACLWLLLYFLPMIYAAMLVGQPLGWAVWVLAATYATAEMGVILVNTSEDLPEDEASGVITTTTALGLGPALILALCMVGAGGAGFAALWSVLLVQAGTGPLITASIVLLFAAWLFAFGGVAFLTRRVLSASSPSEAIAQVKRQGMMVPVWAMSIGLAGVVAAVVRFSSIR